MTSAQLSPSNDAPPTGARLHALILAGGSGTRLWPLSRQELPKQFMPAFDGQSLFERTLLRCQGLAPNPSVRDVCIQVLGSFEHRFLLSEQLAAAGVGAKVWLEPIPRGTAASVALALQDLPADDLVLVCPSDHHIPDLQAFSDTVEAAVPGACQGHLVLFGVWPSSPSSAYGYMVHGPKHASGALRIESFVEKPSASVAQELLRDGKAWWNAGMVLARVGALRREFEQHASQVWAKMQEAAQGRQVVQIPGPQGLVFEQADQGAFEACPNVSLDVAVLEPSDKVLGVAFSGAWSDVGSWSAFADLLPADENGNRTQGHALVREASNTYVRAPHRPVIALGTQDLLIVDTPDALLVAHRSREQDVRKAVEDLRAKGFSQAVAHRKSRRPWGWYDVVDQEEGFVVKRIGVKPGASLSLQMHHHRAEHWVVVRGTAEVTCGDKVFLLSENQSTYIPLGAVHRLRNPGKIELQVLEVQTGSYLQEDDIVRLQDAYGREQPAA